MSAGIQVVSFLYSFSYGCLFALFSYYIKRKYSKRHILIRIFVDMLFVIIASVLFMYGLYKINYGILHLYFILVYVFGYFIINVKMCKWC